MRDRYQEIYDSLGIGALRRTGSREYGKLKILAKNYADPVLDINYSLTSSAKYSSLPTKAEILNAITNSDYSAVREYSNKFVEYSGIYQELCRYLATLYRYDWYVVPFAQFDKITTEITDNTDKKLLKEFQKTLDYLDHSYLKNAFRKISWKVVVNGCYYGYVISTSRGISFQELPIGYCRSRFSINGYPVIEFNMRFFDDKYSDPKYRYEVLKGFPKEFLIAYKLYKAKKLPPLYKGDKEGWYILNTAYAFKLNCDDSDFPILANVMPAILDLNEAQALDRKKTMQKLLKVFIQKLPLDKNNDLVFDMDEAADIHETAAEMLSRTVGVDVFTTFADTTVVDLADDKSATSVDDLAKVERTLFNEAGVSQSLFNADSNLALSNSILTDEATIKTLLLQFEALMNKVLNASVNSKKSDSYKFKILETTIFNYKEMAKTYKEQTQIGYSKMLPQIALGHPQSEILSSILFENNVLHLTQIMLPPMSSNVMSAAVLGNNNNNNRSNNNNSSNNNSNNNESSGETGRPEKPDTEKSEKTIANRESM